MRTTTVSTMVEVVAPRSAPSHLVKRTVPMEAAAIFSVALLRGVRAGAVLTALWNVERTNAGLPDKRCESSERAINCAVGAIRRLIENDKKEHR